MKIAIIPFFIFISVSLLSFSNKPQAQKSKETFIIYVFDNDTKKLTNILLYDTVLGKKGAALVEKFENSSFFTGFLNGDFKEYDGEILPLKGARSFVVLKDNSALIKNKNIPELLKKKHYPGSDVFFPVKEFIPGDMFVIYLNSIESKIKVEVMKNNKKEIVLKVL